MPRDWLQVPFVQQSHDGDCLPACAAMILQYWQDAKSSKRISRLLGTEYFGTPPKRIERLTRWGYIVNYRQATLEALVQSIARNIPPIAMVKTGFLDYWDEFDTGHAVVIVGINERHVLLNDPAFSTAPQVATVDGFAAAWIERNEMAAFIQPC